MIAVKGLGCGFDSRNSKLHQEILSARNTTGHHRADRNTFSLNAAPRTPDQLAVQRERFRSGAAGEYDGIGTAQRAEWFAQASSRKQAVTGVLGRDQDDVEIAGQSAMLEAIIKQVQLRPEFLFRKAASFITVLAYDDGDVQPSCHEYRLIAEFASRAGRVNQQYAARAASVAAGEDIKLYVALLEQLAKEQNKGRFTGTAH